MENLTQNEQQILNLALEGLNNSQIALKLNQSKEEIKSTLTITYQKLGVTNRVQVAIKYSKIYLNK